MESFHQMITRNTAIEFNVWVPDLNKFLATENSVQMIKKHF